MAPGSVRTLSLLTVLVSLTTMASAQSFRVQCPTSTITHPSSLTDVNAEPAYTGPTTLGLNGNGFYAPTAKVNGAIKCQQISGGDGYATMGDGTQTYMFSFGPLSGLADIANGRPGTQYPVVFNAMTPTTLRPGDPATARGAVANTWGSWPQIFSYANKPFAYNGAVGLAYNIPNLVSIYDISEVGTTVTVIGNAPLGVAIGNQVTISGQDTTGYNGTRTVTAINVPNNFFPANYAFQYTNPTTGLGEVTESTTASAGIAPTIDGHVDPRPIMDVGVMNGNIPAPLMAIDEDDEFFLTLTNVGMIMRPDLFEQHTVHFHGYPNASSFYDGVPDASVAINIGGSFTYYYLAPDAGTYFWHCHITPPEHLQMGMVGQIYVRPRQNRVPAGSSLYAALQAAAGRSAHGVQFCHRHPVQQSAAGCQYRCDWGSDGPGGRNQRLRLQRWRRLDLLRRRVSHPDPRLRSQLPLCRHDLQPGRVRRHEGQVLPAERPQLSRHGHPRSAGTRSRRTAPCTSRSRCPRSSTFRRAERRFCASPTWTLRNIRPWLRWEFR